MTEQQRSRRLFFLLPFAPRLDAAHGGGRVMGQLIWELAARHQVAILYLRAADEAPIDLAIAGRCALVEEARRPLRGATPIDRWRFRLEVWAGRLRGRPEWVSAWAVPAYGARARELVASWQPELVQIEYHLMAQYLPALAACHAPRLLTQYDPGTAAARERWRSRRGYARAAARLDLLAWQRYERSIMSQVQAVVTFTERDAREVAALAPKTPAVQIPFGTALPERPLSPTGAPPPSLLFVGSFVHSPNVDAAMRLAQEIFPLVRARGAAAKLVIVGDRPPPQLQRLASDQVEITGYVPDITPYLDRAAVVVVPLRLGGGMRVKVQEALAAGKAIVASALAVSGLPLVDGEHALIADSDQQFADAVVELLASPERRTALATGARAWACAHLSWEKPVAAYEALYSELSDSRSVERKGPQLCTL